LSLTASCSPAREVCTRPQVPSLPPLEIGGSVCSAWRR
jgi:hypothetical protein